MAMTLEAKCLVGLLIWALHLGAGAAQSIDSGGGDVAVNGGTICKPNCQSINVAPCPPPPPPLDPCKNGNCHWDGTAPSCSGSCSGQTMQCGNSRSGDGASCWTGSKALCCSIPQVPDYRCDVRVTAMCGCGNNMVTINCDDFKAGTCRNEPRTTECSLLLDAFQLKGGGDACNSGSDAAHSAVPPWMLIILLMCFFVLPGLGQNSYTINSGGGAVAVEGGIVCAVTCTTASEVAQETSSSASDSSGGISSESASSGEGTASGGEGEQQKSGNEAKPRRLQSESVSRSKTKASTMCGCGNEWMQVDCEMYQNKVCKMSNQQSQSKSETGLQIGVGPKLGADASQTVTSNNQACDAALKVFGGDENRKQTCTGESPADAGMHAASPSLGIQGLTWATSLSVFWQRMHL
eukprot:TRINITY_DN72991_c0_g1_i1.p1 TRINITY_DN72991_c0_g1~~TRINITY_DN72991_c0_g1_i1.p1  ORF type:complete len:407 (+),score=55.40 TRINITY_DN72991_c0_g1_i1:50-1270(+)